MTLAIFIGSAASIAALLSPWAHPKAQYAPDTTAKHSTANDTTPKVTFGAFVDTYYAWDFNRPHTFDRAFTTQPARHGEFNINLAYVESNVAGPRYRGHVALQWGTSVQANYLAEPHIGTISGPSVSQFIQEAIAGYQLGPTLWVDAGVFLAHVGLESWISRDNLTYTRSMVADFSPYYESGAKLTWTPSPKATLTTVIVNGWQNISAENSTPGTGLRFDYSPNPKLTVTYDNYFGNSAPDSVSARLRFYHDVIAQYSPTDRWKLAAAYAIGTQSHSTSRDGTASWWGTTLIGKYYPRQIIGVVARVESYADPSQVIVVTGVPNAFRTASASLGVDINFRKPILWRTEVRGYRSRDGVWPQHFINEFGRGDGFVVTSMALTF